MYVFARLCGGTCLYLRRLSALYALFIILLSIVPDWQKYGLRFLLYVCLVANSAGMSTLAVHCLWEDETTRERTGHPLNPKSGCINAISLWTADLIFWVNDRMVLLNDMLLQFNKRVVWLNDKPFQFNYRRVWLNDKVFNFNDRIVWLNDKPSHF